MRLLNRLAYISYSFNIERAVEAHLAALAAAERIATTRDAAETFAHHRTSRCSRSSHSRHSWRELSSEHSSRANVASDQLMLDYLCGSLLYTPLRLLLVMLVAGIACGAMGWRRISAQAHVAWERGVVCPEIVGLGVYRAASWKTRLLRMPRLVRALGFTSYALSAGHVITIVVSIDAALRSNGLLATTAGALAGLGIIMSRGARAIVIRGFAEVNAGRSRVALCAILSLLVHGTIVLGLVALWLGWFDTWHVDAYYPGLRGKWAPRWETISLHEFSHKGSWLFDPLVGGYHYETWRALGWGGFACACLALVEAGAALVAARQMGIEERLAGRCLTCPA